MMEISKLNEHACQVQCNLASNTLTNFTAAPAQLIVVVLIRYGMLYFPIRTHSIVLLVQAGCSVVLTDISTCVAFWTSHERRMENVSV